MARSMARRVRRRAPVLLAAMLGVSSIAAVTVLSGSVTAERAGSPVAAEAVSLGVLQTSKQASYSKALQPRARVAEPVV